MALPASPTEQFPYQLQAKIGEGAMGEVYKAIEPSLGRLVAIKTLKKSYLDALSPARAQESSQRFMQEARAAARLSHPGIMTIYRVGVADETPYIAMEWLEGEDLENLIERDGMVRIERAVEIAIELLEALDVAHKAGVVHRDIKPANIMLLTNGRVKVTDFGVARMRDSDLVKTQAGAILGTPLYACPEQIHGTEVDARADVYSAGVVLYEMLTSRLPYEAESVIALIQMIISNYKPVAPENYNAGISPDLSRVIRVAMSKEKEERYSDALSMANALRPFAGGGVTAMSTNATLPATAPANAVLPQVLAPVEVVHGVERAELVANFVKTWPARPLGQQVVAALLEKLLERPLHAPAFSGGAHIGQAFLLIHNGLIYAIFDPDHGTVSDAVFEDLPESANTTLYPVSEDYEANIIIALSSVLLPPKVLHKALDSSFVDLQQLVSKLVAESFSGAIRFHHEGGQAFLLLEGGQTLSHIFSQGWARNPAQAPWPTWISQLGAKASVEEQRVVLSSFSYRRELESYVFLISVAAASGADMRSTAAEMRLSSAGTSITQSFTVQPANAPQDIGVTLTNIYTSDPIYQFIHWMGSEMFSYFAERERLKKWKYLAEWVNLVTQATIHHKVERPGTNHQDFFDLVTSDATGKILHLGRRYAHGSAAALQDFVDTVIEAKKSRIKTGDVGGAFFIAPQIDEDALDLYDKITSAEEKKKRSLFHSITDAFTGYEGFVRLGGRRGFHLLMVVETEEGFRPVLPTG